MQTEAGNNAFDQAVQQKMSALRPDYRPDSWERLATRLDAAEGAEDFEEAIASRLQQIEVPYQPASWEVLAARLAAEEDAAAFDEALGQRLQGVSAPYRPSSWEALAARLEVERQRIRAVLHYKTMELTLLLLLFMTAWQHLPLNESPVPADNDWPQYPIASLEEQPAPRAATTLSTDQAQPDPTSQSRAAQTLATAPLPLAYAEVVTTATARIPNWSEPGKEVPATNKEIAPLPSQSPGLLADQSGPQERLAALRAEKASAISSPADPVIAEGPMAALSASAPALLDYGQAEELLRYIRPSERRTFLRVGFSGGPDYNRIITPPQRIEDGSIYTSARYALGYSGGISLGVEHNERWEVETGLFYAARRYQAIPTVFVTGSVKDGFSGYSLQDFELNTFSAPLNFRYNFLVHDKWRIYTQIGAALNVVVQANYYAVDEGAFSSLRTTTGADLENGISRATKPDILKRKSFNDGWLDGGNFWENATLYGDLGFGLERYMTADWGVFVQPHYQHALPFFNDGLGPYEDKIHNFSIRMGLRVRL